MTRDDIEPWFAEEDEPVVLLCGDCGTRIKSGLVCKRCGAEDYADDEKRLGYTP